MAGQRRTRPAGVHPHRRGPAGRHQRPLAPGRPPLPLETSLPGVFAAGDVRRGSVNRVASAVGEGAATIPLVHRYLHTTAAAPSRRGPVTPSRPAHPQPARPRSADSGSSPVNVPTPTEHNVIAIPQVRRPKMEQIMTGVTAQKSSSHPRAAAATVTDIMRAPLTTSAARPRGCGRVPDETRRHDSPHGRECADRPAAASSPRQTSPAQSQTGKTSTTSGSMPR